MEVLLIYPEIVVVHHLFSDSPNKRDKKKVLCKGRKKNKETQQYISFTIKYM